jgi:hypothetical protein
MARGFESKQVEEQQSAAQRESVDGQKQPLTPEQQERKRQRDGLELVRAKIQNDLAASTNERHKAMLEMALKDVEGKLGKL